MKKILIFCCAAALFCTGSLLEGKYLSCFSDDSSIVKSFKRVYISEYPGSYNPSLMKLNEHYVLTFRYQPDRAYKPWISYIGIALLDASFNVIGKPELLNTRAFDDNTPSQSEDARIFSFDGNLYIVFNDNMDFENPNYWERRDMYLAELNLEDGKFYLGPPLRLIHTEKYRNTLWQKNWSPFEWEGNLLLSYSINPHEVIRPNLIKGSCKSTFTTEKPISWEFGTLRGSTPAQLIDGEYLAFFHSGTTLTSEFSDNLELWHYFMGAYTFSQNPPFELTSISASPINAEGFYTYSHYHKRVVYPGGFVVDGSNIYLALGKDDAEIWIATLDLNELKKTMVPLMRDQ